MYTIKIKQLINDKKIKPEYNSIHEALLTGDIELYSSRDRAIDPYENTSKLNSFTCRIRIPDEIFKTGTKSTSVGFNGYSHIYHNPIHGDDLNNVVRDAILYSENGKKSAKERNIRLNSVVCKKAVLMYVNFMLDFYKDVLYIKENNLSRKILPNTYESEHEFNLWNKGMSILTKDVDVRKFRSYLISLLETKIF